MDPHQRWPEERREPWAAVRARRRRLARTAGIGSLVAITGYLIGSGGDGAADGTTTAPDPAVSIDASGATTSSTAAPVATAIAATDPSTTEPVASTATTEPVDAAPACTTTYTVVAGDSWYGIADAASVEVSVLYRLNAAGDATMLFPGESICLPAGTVVTTTAPAVTAAAAAPTTSSSTSSNATAAMPGSSPTSSSHGS